MLKLNVRWYLRPVRWVTKYIPLKRYCWMIPKGSALNSDQSCIHLMINLYDIQWLNRYGKHRTVATPSNTTSSALSPPSPAPLRTSGGRASPITVSPPPVHVAAVPPLSISTSFNGSSPPSPTSPGTPTAQHPPQPTLSHPLGSKIFLIVSRSSIYFCTGPNPSQASTDEQEAQFEDLVSQQ